MAYLILSDIHSNLEALEAVLADARGHYDRILCCGDLVGYGADPNAVTDWSRSDVRAVVRGNHDKACVDAEPLEGYNMAARKSAEWTREQLTAENRTYLENLPRGPLTNIPDAGISFDLVHGSPVDEDEYLIAPVDVWSIGSSLAMRLTFFGHTHVQGGFLLTRNGVQRISAGRTLEIGPDDIYLVNPGSVGQPRDSDPRAAYVLYDTEKAVVDFRRVAYDVEAAGRKIRAAGLPDSLAQRLQEGL